MAVAPPASPHSAIRADRPSTRAAPSAGGTPSTSCAGRASPHAPACSLVPAPSGTSSSRGSPVNNRTTLCSSLPGSRKSDVAASRCRDQQDPIPSRNHEPVLPSITGTSALSSTPEQPEFLTVSQIANRLQMSPQAVRDWIETGLLRGIRVRKVWRVRREDFERLLASLETGPATAAGGWEEKARRGFVDPEETSGS